jgi:dsRNA-specific ribonuclease
MIITYETNEMFRNLVVSILKRAKLRTKTIDLILESKLGNKTGLELYGIAFTHKSVDPLNNYEVYEFKGDSTANNCLVWYFSRRFDELNVPDHVKTLARLKINYGSKKTFYEIGDKLGMWDFISATTEKRVNKKKVKLGNRIVVKEEEVVVDIRQTKKKSLLEDSFEAFIGVTQTLLDMFVKQGEGFKICYKIIESLYDDMDIKLDHESLYDAKTRLKELFDKYCDKFGKWDKNNVNSIQIKNRFNDYSKWKVQVGYNIQTNDNKLTKLTEMLELYMYDETRTGDIICPKHVIDYVKNNFIEKNKPSYKFVLLGEGEASLKDDAEQLACECALKKLSEQGFKK